MVNTFFQWRGVGVMEYVDARKISTGPKYVVARARRAADGRPVVLKTLLPGTRASADTLRQQYEILTRLQGTGAVAAIGVETIGGSPALVLEDAGPRNLSQFLRHCRRLTTDAFFALALPLAQLVGRIHERSVIHRNIAPANIVLDDDSRPTM